MTMNFELKMTQTTRLVMTQELRQSIALLQLSSHELLDCIQDELAGNPLLEATEEGENETGDIQETVEEHLPLQEKLEPDHHFDEDEYATSYLPTEPRYERNPHYLENCLSREKNLPDYLSFQLKTAGLDERTQLIGEYLIGNLDANGYLQGEPVEHACHLGVTPDEIWQALSLIQSFDPPGVGACSLEDCLLLQLSRLSAVPLDVEKIVARYLPEVAAGKYRLVAGKLGISMQELQEALNLIRRLNPKPGACFGDGTAVGYITPDIIVEKIDGQYVISSGDRIPRLVVNSFYRGMLRHNKDEHVRGFIKKNLEGAQWFIKSIEHRQKVIHQVATEIVRVQESFLEHGLHHLKPLTLKAVAAVVGVHESTVSRATTNKYMQTPRGLYPMKFFFPGSIGGDAGVLYANAGIKQTLRDLIEGEDGSIPLSDQQLAELLRKKGIKISRRTVAKYREEMDIPPSFRRRCL